MRVAVHAHVDALPPAARELMATAADCNLFSTPVWFSNFLATVVQGDGRVEFVVAGETDDAPAAILPLWHRRPARPWSPRRLESLANYYTCLYEPITCADETRGRAALAALAAWFVTGRRAWDALDLTPMDATHWRYRALQEAFTARGLVVHRYFAFGNWILECGGMSFEDYFRSRGGSTRNRVRSKRKQLEQRYRVEMSVATDGPGLDAAIAHYDAVYAVSWKQPEPYPGFMPGLIRSFAQAGWLRLGIMLLDGRPAAAQVWFVAGGIAYIYKLAYDPEFADYQVGTLLTMHLFEHVLDRDRVSCIDFLSGDDEYKARWMSTRRERHGLEVIRTGTVRGAALMLRRTVGALRRRWLAWRRGPT